MHPKLSGICTPVTQSNINLTPSRWCGLSTLVNIGSTSTCTGNLDLLTKKKKNEKKLNLE